MYFLFIVTQTFWVFSQYLPCILHHILKYFVIHIWAATWQNQQNECAPSEDSDQPGHPPILISLCCPHEESLGPKLPIKRTAKTLTRLGRCPGWSESSLGAHLFCWFCHVVAHFIFSGYNVSIWYNKWATSWQNLLLPYANNKGADQPAHQCSLIGAFVVHCLDSIIPLVSITKISSLYLASLAAWAGLCLAWSQTPKTGFLVMWLIFYIPYFSGYNVSIWYNKWEVLWQHQELDQKYWGGKKNTVKTL